MSGERDDTPEIRVDPLSGLRVIVAGSRASRPGGLSAPEPPPPIDPEKDPFAEGNESMTPPEVWADRPSGSEPDTPGWRVRAVPNLYPALVESPAQLDNTAAGAPTDPLDGSRGMPQLFTQQPAYGVHEVIVNAPEPVQTLADVTREQLEAVLSGWATRMRASMEREDVAYAQLCLNEGRDAGASLPHTHAQLYSLPFVPALVARERERMRAYFEQTQGRNLVEDMLAEEVRGRDRLVAIDDDAALIAPYASGSPLRLMIVPRTPEPRFEDAPRRAVGMLHAAYRGVREMLGGMPSLNLFIRTAPRGCDDFCWRIEFAPRLGQAAGFEMGTGVWVNARTPESAAAEMRDAVARLD